MSSTITITKRARLAVLATLLLNVPLLFAGSESLTGMVWENYGGWHLNGNSASLRLGEAIPPGALITADAQEGAQSIVILLPDGQRLLGECYDARLCAQGFRVPAMPVPPATAVWKMFLGVRNVLLTLPPTAHLPFPPNMGRAALAANVEIVTPLNSSGDISIVSALSVLPTGRYTLAVAEDGPSAPSSETATQPLEWTAPKGPANVRILKPGIYRIRITDASSVVRMRVEVLVTTAALYTAESGGLKQARETIMGWSQNHPGWPLHDFLRAYLQSRASSPAS